MSRVLIAATAALCCLFAQAQPRAGGGSALGAAPGEKEASGAAPMNPYASTSPQLNAARPVLELLVTLTQLRTLAGSLALSPEQVAALHGSLKPVLSGAEVTVDSADVLRAALLDVLDSAQLQRLAAQREAQTARLRALLSRARLMSDDGRPQTARLAYSQWIGSEAVTALLADLLPQTVTRTVRAAATQTEAALSGR